MPTTVDIKNLKINKLTEVQYDTAVQGGVIGENELSVLTDAELEQIQVSALPTASADELGKIYQYIGATDSTYTNGYFYKCVSDGQTPATYSWTAVEVQASSGGLPTQTGNAGKFLTTDGTDASWTNEISNTNPLYFTGHNRNGCGLYIGDTSGTYGNRFIKLFSQEGYSLMIENAAFNGTLKFEFGNAVYLCALNAPSGSNLGSNTYKWTRLYSTKINNGADITVPTTGGTMAVMNTPTTMPELAVADWSSNTQTVNVTGVTASNVVFVSPAPASASDYASAGIVCTAQAAGTLTFTCTTVPSNAITVNVVILG